MSLEDQEEEVSEVIKHLNEEVPVETDIWCKVLYY